LVEKFPTHWPAGYTAMTCLLELVMNFPPRWLEHHGSVAAASPMKGFVGSRVEKPLYCAGQQVVMNLACHQGGTSICNEHCE
jgi:hypothetical protein